MAVICFPAKMFHVIPLKFTGWNAQKSRYAPFDAMEIKQARQDYSLKNCVLDGNT